MFYIKTFYKVLLSKPMSAAMWFLGLALITLSFTGKKSAEGFLTLQATKVNKNPYFFAVMPKEINTGYVQRKLLDLPGVEKVNVMAQESIVGHVRSVLESTQLEWDQDILDVDYTGVKVFLSPDLKSRSQSLIRNYLSRIAGERDVTLGAIKTPTKVKQKLSLSGVLDKSFNFLPILGVGLFLLSLFSLRKEVY